ncbi:MAG: hypothetical protein GXO48_08095 [Chlorobi bacterium]|nr:hypothetical protein [Chlorobiota bacterium]
MKKNWMDKVSVMLIKTLQKIKENLKFIVVIIFASLTGAFTTHSQNVGIGVPNPQSRLHITAPSGFISPLLKVEISGSSNPYLIVQPDGKVGIGTSNPAGSSILDISSTDKGVLLPRLTLSGYRDTVTTATKPDTALLVYHKGRPSMPPGYYFWDGEKWKSLQSYTNTHIVFEKIITPCELFNNAWINPAESVSVDTNCKYIQFDGGAPEEELLVKYKILDRGILPSVNDGIKYIVEIEIGREVLPKGGSGRPDCDDMYGLSDSIQGIGFTIPDKSSAGLFYLLYYTPSNLLTASSFTYLDGSSSSSTTQRKHAEVVFSVDSSGIFGIYKLAHTYNSIASGFAPVVFDPYNGIFFEMYTGLPGTVDDDEQVRLRYIKITIKMTDY